VGLSEKYVRRGLPLRREPIGQWASAHYLIEAGRPDIAARKLQDEIERGAALKQRAAVWRSVLLAGMGQSCLELSRLYREGALRNPELAGQFFGYVQNYGTCAKRYARELNQILADRANWLGETPLVTLESNPPLVTSDEHLIAEIRTGVLPNRTDALKLYSHHLQTGVSEVLRRMSPLGEREVPVSVFLATMQTSMLSLAQAMGEPDRSSFQRLASSLTTTKPTAP